MAELDKEPEFEMKQAAQDGLEKAISNMKSLNTKHREQLTQLIHFLSSSSDEQQREQYLNRLLKEI